VHADARKQRHVDAAHRQLPQVNQYSRITLVLSYIILGRYKTGDGRTTRRRVSYFSASRVRSHRLAAYRRSCQHAPLPSLRDRWTISVTRRPTRLAGRHSAPLNWRLSRPDVSCPWISRASHRPGLSCQVRSKLPPAVTISRPSLTYRTQIIEYIQWHQDAQTQRWYYLHPSYLSVPSSLSPSTPTHWNYNSVTPTHLDTSSISCDL